MKVLFISLSMPDLIMPTLPLGLVSVATAAQRDGHEVRILDSTAGSDAAQQAAEAIAAFAPDAIGISVRNIDDQSMRETRFLLEPLQVDSCELPQAFKSPHNSGRCWLQHVSGAAA